MNERVKESDMSEREKWFGDSVKFDNQDDRQWEWWREPIAARARLCCVTTGNAAHGGICRMHLKEMNRANPSWCDRHDKRFKKTNLMPKYSTQSTNWHDNMPRTQLLPSSDAAWTRTINNDTSKRLYLSMVERLVLWCQDATNFGKCAINQACQYPSSWLMNSQWMERPAVLIKIAWYKSSVISATECINHDWRLDSSLFLVFYWRWGALASFSISPNSPMEKSGDEKMDLRD